MMPSGFVLSSKSIGLLAEAIDSGFSKAEMGTLFLKADVDAWEPTDPPNKLDRAVKLLKSLRSGNSKEANEGAMDLSRLVLVASKPRPKAYGTSEPTATWQAFRDALAADGWEFDQSSDRLVPTVPVLQMANEISWLDIELGDRGWETAAGHYRQAIDSFASGNWAAANSQLRAFIEDVIPLAAGMPDSGGRGQVQEAFKDLDDAGQLVEDEQEFGKSLWKLLHKNGSHPGLSDEDESRFRLLTITGYVRYLLGRVERS